MLAKSMGWLGIGRDDSVAGLHLRTQGFTLVVMRPNPLRLIGMAETEIAPAHLAGPAGRRHDGLADAVAELASRLRFRRGGPVIATFEPTVGSLGLSYDTEGSEPIHVIDGAIHRRVESLVVAAGLMVRRLDLIPLSLARMALVAGQESVALRDPSGWSVVLDDGFIDAERTEPRSAQAGLRMGPDLHSTAAVHGLPAIEIPGRIAAEGLPPGLAPAVGAALAGFGLAPLVSVRSDAGNHDGPGVHRQSPRGR